VGQWHPKPLERRLGLATESARASGYVVFHDKVDPDMYEELDENERSCLTLYGVKNTQETALGPVYEDELPLYDRGLQANKYNEGARYTTFM
jgi:hypothetical protein